MDDEPQGGHTLPCGRLPRWRYHHVLADRKIDDEKQTQKNYFFGLQLLELPNQLVRSQEFGKHRSLLD